MSPLGAVSLLANALIAPALLHERITASDVLGMALAVLGTVSVVVSIGASQSPALDMRLLWAALARPVFLVYAGLNAAAGAALIALSHTRAGQRFMLVHVGVCAVFGGFTVLATKGLSSLLVHARATSLLTEPLLYALVAVLVGTAVIQLVYLNRALQHFEARHVIPTQFVLFTISTIVGSSILYRDFAALGWAAICGFSFGCACTFLGVVVLTCDQPALAREAEAGGDDAPRVVVEAAGDADAQRAAQPIDVVAPGRGRSAFLAPDAPPPGVERRHSLPEAVASSRTRAHPAVSDSLPGVFTRSRESIAELTAVLLPMWPLPAAAELPHIALPRGPRRTRSRPDLAPHVLSEALGYADVPPPRELSRSTYVGLSPGHALLVGTHASDEYSRSAS